MRWPPWASEEVFASAVMAAISGAPALVPPTGNQGMPRGQPEATDVHSMM